MYRDSISNSICEQVFGTLRKFSIQLSSQRLQRCKVGNNTHKMLNRDFSSHSSILGHELQLNTYYCFCVFFSLIDWPKYCETYLESSLWTYLLPCRVMAHLLLVTWSICIWMFSSLSVPWPLSYLQFHTICLHYCFCCGIISSCLRGFGKTTSSKVKEIFQTEGNFSPTPVTTIVLLFRRVIKACREEVA